MASFFLETLIPELAEGSPPLLNRHPERWMCVRMRERCVARTRGRTSSMRGARNTLMQIHRSQRTIRPVLNDEREGRRAVDVCGHARALCRENSRKDLLFEGSKELIESGGCVSMREHCVANSREDPWKSPPGPSGR